MTTLYYKINDSLRQKILRVLMTQKATLNVIKWQFFKDEFDQNFNDFTTDVLTFTLTDEQKSKLNIKDSDNIEEQYQNRWLQFLNHELLIQHETFGFFKLFVDTINPKNMPMKLYAIDNDQELHRKLYIEIEDDLNKNPFLNSSNYFTPIDKDDLPNKDLINIFDNMYYQEKSNLENYFFTFSLFMEEL